MTVARRLLAGLPVWLLVVACASLGLAPFTPPHLVEKVGMLLAGELRAPVDVFDLLLHASPWVLLALRLTVGRSPGSDDPRGGDGTGAGG